MGGRAVLEEKKGLDSCSRCILVLWICARDWKGKILLQVCVYLTLFGNVGCECVKI